MIVQNLTTSAYEASISDDSGDYTFYIPAGGRLELPSTVAFNSTVRDSWTEGKAYVIINAGDGPTVFREKSITNDYLYGLSFGLPCAVLLLLVWATKRGLRPSLEHM